MPAASPRLRRTAVAVVATAVASLLAIVAAPASALAADPPPTITGQPCEAGVGVTVVVDHQDQGGLAVGCAEGEQASGYAALTAAGFTYNEDVGESPFLCQIGGVPATVEPDCWTTGYWAYWKSDGSAPWDYSMVGADGGPVAVGTVEGWSWTAYDPDSFDGKLPRIAVADLAGLLPACDHLLGTGGEAAALAWVGCELETNGGTFPGFGGSPDFGLTLDAVMAYALDGRASDPRAAAALAIVDDRILEYVSDAGFGDGTTERYAGALAKSTLAFQLAGRDVADVGGLDLEAELRARMRTSGPDAGRFSDASTWGDFSNGFGQALAILALAHTDGGVPADAVTYLLDQQCPGGGFRGVYDSPGGCDAAADADTDYTSFALQALHSADQTARVRYAQSQAVTFLLGQQDDQGGVSGTGVTAGANANSSAIAAQALRAVGRTTDADHARDWVASRQLVASGAGAAAAEVGAIAYNAAAFDAAVDGGIGSGVRDQWRRTTVQGLLAFDAPPYAPAGAEHEAFPFSSWTAFVDRQYRDLTGKAPTASQRTAAVNALDAGTITKGAFIESLVTVNPNTVDSKIFRLYLGLLDRQPTAANFALWQRRYAAGWTSPRAAEAFLATPDSPFRNLTNQQFVTLLYQKVFGRTPSASSAAPWVQKLQNRSWTRHRMAGYFVDSAEARNRTAPDLRIIALDRGLLRTVPTTARFVAQRDALRSSAKTFAELAEDLLSDPDYLRTFVPVPA